MKCEKLFKVLFYSTALIGISTSVLTNVDVQADTADSTTPPTTQKTPDPRVGIDFAATGNLGLSGNAYTEGINVDNNGNYTGLLTLNYTSTSWATDINISDDLTYAIVIPIEFRNLFSDPSITRYLDGSFALDSLIGGEEVPLTSEDFSLNSDGSGLNVTIHRGVGISFGQENIKIQINMHLASAIKATGIHIPNAENGESYDFNTALLKGNNIIWNEVDLNGDRSASAKIPTSQLDFTNTSITQPTVSDLYVGDTTVTGYSDPGNKITVTDPQGKTYFGITNNNGMFSVGIPPQEKGTTLTVTASKNGVTSDPVVVTVKEKQQEIIPMPGIDKPVKEGATSISGTGTTPGNTITIKDSLGNSLGTSQVTADHSYTVNLIRAAKGGETLSVTESNANTSSQPNSIVVEKNDTPVNNNKITNVDNFKIGTSAWVTGTFSGSDVKRVQLVIDGKVQANVPVTDDTSFKYYAQELITSPNQNVEVQILDASLNVLDSKPVNVVE
ncbi:hypothetical protein D920_00162 [Enterococcus faecalis 13-SD-W-01]|nr:hypothetical protein D920_00162 [Enterococcus faecalis 13-SD-W-01]